MRRIYFDTWQAACDWCNLADHSNEDVMWDGKQYFVQLDGEKLMDWQDIAQSRTPFGQ